MNQNPHKGDLEQTSMIRRRLMEQYGIVEEGNIVELSDLEIREELPETEEPFPVKMNTSECENSYAGSV